MREIGSLEKDNQTDLLHLGSDCHGRMPSRYDTATPCSTTGRRFPLPCVPDGGYLTTLITAVH